MNFSNDIRVHSSFFDLKRVFPALLNLKDAVCGQQIMTQNAVRKQQMIIFATTILNYNSYGDAFC